MKETLIITSPESLDANVAEVVRLKIKHKAQIADMEAEKARVERRHTPKITAILQNIAEKEEAIQKYCMANRSALFVEKKSRETVTAVFGFEFTPYRVETTSRKITWKEVVKRLARLDWGKAYVREPAPQTDKDGLLKDREKLTEEQRTAAGIKFERDEQFFIRPKSEIADDTVKEAA